MNKLSLSVFVFLFAVFFGSAEAFAVPCTVTKTNYQQQSETQDVGSMEECKNFVFTVGDNYCNAWRAGQQGPNPVMLVYRFGRLSESQNFGCAGSQPEGSTPTPPEPAPQPSGPTEPCRINTSAGNTEVRVPVRDIGACQNAFNVFWGETICRQNANIRFTFTLDMVTKGRVGSGTNYCVDNNASGTPPSNPTPPRTPEPSNPTPPSNGGNNNDAGAAELRARLLREARECVGNAYREFLERDPDPGSEGYVNGIISGQYDCLEARARIRYSPEGNAVAKRKENEQREAEFQARNQNSVDCVNRAILEVFGEERSISSFGAIVHDINFNRTRCGADTTERVKRTPEARAMYAEQERVRREEEFRVKNDSSVACVQRWVDEFVSPGATTGNFGGIVNMLNMGRLSCDPGARNAIYNSNEAKNRRAEDARLAADDARRAKEDAALACVAKWENDLLGHALPASIAQNLVNQFVRGTLDCPRIRGFIFQYAENEKNPPAPNDPPPDENNGFNVMSTGRGSTAKPASSRGTTSTTTARPAATGGATARPSGGGGRLSIQSAGGTKKPAVKPSTTKKKK
ncbi:MAG: hypothetical protein ABL958_06070 [Bdellovibrionia bacterium]